MVLQVAGNLPGGGGEISQLLQGVHRVLRCKGGSSEGTVLSSPFQ